MARTEKQTALQKHVDRDLELNLQGEELLHEHEARDLVCSLMKGFYQLGWVSGTGGGITMVCRSNRQHVEHPRKKCIVMAPSAVQKERLKSYSCFLLDFATGGVISPGKDDYDEHLILSQCAPLFMSAYHLRNAGAVIHSHSPNAVLASLLFDKEFKVTGLEMIKGITGHQNTDELVVPIIMNTRSELNLTKRLQTAIADYPRAYCVLVKGHGAYIWGRSWQKTKAHAECYDFLFGMVSKLHNTMPSKYTHRLFKVELNDKFPVDDTQDEDSVSGLKCSSVVKRALHEAQSTDTTPVDSETVSNGVANGVPPSKKTKTDDSSAAKARLSEE